MSLPKRPEWERPDIDIDIATNRPLGRERSPGGYIPATIYGAQIPLRINAKDKTTSVRLGMEAAAKNIAHVIVQTWLNNPGDYDIDITLTMEKKS